MRALLLKYNEEMTCSAAYSQCGKYRYFLWGQIQPPLFGRSDSILLFLMLNPSTATEEKLDPTVTRCRNHAERLDFDEYGILNLFAYRATDPNEMKAADDPIGPINDSLIKSMVEDAPATIVACGEHAEHLDRYKFLDELPADKLYYFCKNKPKNGRPALPKHPLYIPRNAEVRSWRTDEIVDLKGRARDGAWQRKRPGADYPGDNGRD